MFLLSVLGMVANFNLFSGWGFFVVVLLKSDEQEEKAKVLLPTLSIRS